MPFCEDMKNTGHTGSIFDDAIEIAVFRQHPGYCKCMQPKNHFDDHICGSGGCGRARWENKLNDETAQVMKDALSDLLEEMDVPKMRRDLDEIDNLRWLHRNLLIQNHGVEANLAHNYLRMLLKRQHNLDNMKGKS